MSDVTVLRAVVEGDASLAQKELEAFDVWQRQWAARSRPAPRVEIFGVKEARAEIAGLDREYQQFANRVKQTSLSLSLPKSGSAGASVTRQAFDLERNQLATWAKQYREAEALQSQYQKVRLADAQRGNAAWSQAQESARAKEMAALRADIQERAALGQRELQGDLARAKETARIQEQLRRDLSRSNTNSRTLIDSAETRGGALGERMAARLKRDYGAPTQSVSTPSMGARLERAGQREMMSGALLSASITAPLVGLGRFAENASANFEQEMNKVAGLTNIGRDNIGRYHKALLDMAGDPLISKGPAELAQGLFIAASNTKTDADALDVLRASARGATAGLGDLSSVTKADSGALNAWKMPASQAAHVLDVLTNAAKQGGVEAKQFATALPKVGSTAAAAGLSIEETAASIATMTRVGIPANTAATSLNRLLMGFIKPSEAAKKAVRELGTSFDELLNEVGNKGLQQTLADLFGRAGNDEKKLTPIFGSMNSIRAALSTQGSQAQDYSRIVGSFSNIGGLTDKAAETALSGTNVEFEKLRSSAEAAGIAVGDRFLPRLTPLVKAAGVEVPRAIDTLLKSWDNLSDGEQKTVEYCLGMLAILGPLKLIQGNVLVLTGALFEMGKGVKMIGALSPLKALGGLFGGGAVTEGAVAGEAAAGAGGLAALGTGSEWPHCHPGGTRACVGSSRDGHLQLSSEGRRRSDRTRQLSALGGFGQ
jgi:TP901 family phage tail tape measure protein